MKVFGVILCATLIFQGCSLFLDNDDSRNVDQFEWSTDTLRDDQHLPDVYPLTLGDIWGTSADNLYAAGWSTASASSLWHYDGKTWKRPKHLTEYGGTIQATFNAGVVYGFGENDVWVAGNDAYDFLRVIHYNGSVWEEIPVEPQTDFFIIDNIWGPSPDDIWITGREYGRESSKHSIFHWDGDSLRREYIRATPTSREHFTSFAGNNSGLLYSAPYQYINYQKTQYLLKYESGAWKLLNESDNAILSIWLSPGGTLFGVGVGFLSWNGIEWKQWSDNSFLSGNLSGTSDTDILVSDESKGLRWFDGISLSEPLEKIVFEPGSNVFRGVWYNGKEAFLLGVLDNGVTVIYHGK